MLLFDGAPAAFLRLQDATIRPRIRSYTAWLVTCAFGVLAVTIWFLLAPGAGARAATHRNGGAVRRARRGLVGGGT